MANVLVEEQVLSDIADAIRENLYTDDTYKPADMPDKVVEVYHSAFNEGEQVGERNGYNKGFEDGKAEGGGGIEQFRAFIEGNHENVVIPEGVTKIKPYAFCEGDGYHDYSLIETVTLPSTLKEIGNNAFGYNSYLYDLILPEGLEYIGDYAFCGNYFESEFVIPSTVKRIGRDIFADSCGSIETVILKGKPTEIKSTAFSSIYGVTIKVPFSEGEVAGAPWGSPSSNIIYDYIEDLIIPEGVTEIEEYEFVDNANIRTVTFPSTLKSIGDYAFSYCCNLQTLTLPEGLEYIGCYAFECCCNLQTLILPEGLEYIGNNAFDMCDSLTGDLVFPTTIKEVGDIFGSSSMVFDSIIFKGTPTRIDQYAFSGAASIGELKVPWSEGEVAGAPWGVDPEIIIYDWIEEE